MRLTITLMIMLSFLISCKEQEQSKCEKAKEHLYKAELALEAAKVAVDDVSRLVDQLCGEKSNPINCENAKKLLAQKEMAYSVAKTSLSIAVGIVETACLIKE